MLLPPSLAEISDTLKKTTLNRSLLSSIATSRKRTSILLLVGDSITLLAVMLIGFYGRGVFSDDQIPLASYFVMFFGILLGNGVVSYWRGIYPGYGLCAIAELRSTFYILTGVIATAAAFGFFTRGAIPYSRSVLLVSWILSVPVLYGVRIIVRKLLSKTTWYGIPVIIIGEHAMARKIVESLKSNASIGLRPLVIVDTSETEAEYGYYSGVPIISGLSNINAICKRYGITHGVITMPNSQSGLAQTIISTHAQHLSNITFVGEHVHPSVVWISNSRSDILIGSEIEQRLMQPALRFKKRLLDVALVIPMLIVAIPIMFVVALVIRLTSKGPIFFRHARVGQSGKQFVMYKFRTMVTNAEEVLSHILSTDEHAREEWSLYHKLKRDPRISKVGQFLRKYSIDELPQLFNVVKGNMSLVGSRPFTSKELIGKNTAEIRAFMALYRSTKPGVTGLWQVSVRNEVAFSVRTHIDYYYMRNWSLFLDIYILLKTVKVVLTGRGSY